MQRKFKELFDFNLTMGLPILIILFIMLTDPHYEYPLEIYAMMFGGWIITNVHIIRRIKRNKSIIKSPQRIIEKKVAWGLMDDILSRDKPFEIRINHPDYKKGDVLLLKEWENEQFTGKETTRTVMKIFDLQSILDHYSKEDIEKYGLVIFGLK